MKIIIPAILALMLLSCTPDIEQPPVTSTVSLTPTVALPDYVTPVTGTPPTHEVFITASALAQTPDVDLSSTTSPTLSGNPLLDYTATPEVFTCLERGTINAPRGVNVRVSNDLKAAIIERLPFGEEVWFYPFRVGDASGGWEWVRLNSGGWIASEFVEHVRGCG